MRAPAVWVIGLDVADAVIRRCAKRLDAQERERAQRLRRPQDRNRFVVAHGAMREILAQALGCAPEALVFQRGRHGKPRLAGPGDGARRLDFNLSHSRDLALLAVGWGMVLGVDVEYWRDPIDVESIARRVFSERERRSLAALPTAFRQEAFFLGWTRKEAYVKALGRGIHRGLGDFDVSILPRRPAVLQATRPDPREARAWRLHHLDVHPDYKAALATPRSVAGFVLRGWPAARSAGGGDASTGPFVGVRMGSDAPTAPFAEPIE